MNRRASSQLSLSRTGLAGEEVSAKRLATTDGFATSFPDSFRRSAICLHLGHLGTPPLILD